MRIDINSDTGELYICEPNLGQPIAQALGPVSEGLYAWIIGIGGLCLIAVWIAAKGARAK